MGGVERGVYVAVVIQKQFCCKVTHEEKRRFVIWRVNLPSGRKWQKWSVIKCYCGFMLYFFQSFSVCNITDNIIAFYRSSPLTTLMSLHSIWSGYIYIFTPHWYNHCCIIIMAGVSRCDCVTIVLLVLLLLWFLLLLSVLLINKCAGLWVRLWLESAVIISAKGQ